MSKLGTAVRGRMKSVKSEPLGTFFRQTIKAQGAAAGPPLGPVLGQYGINIGSFCKDFNEKTKQYKKGLPLPVDVQIRVNKSYEIQIHTPEIEYFLRKAAGLAMDKLEEEEVAGRITVKHAYEIAKIKYEDPFCRMQLWDFQDVVEKVVEIAYKMGIEVVRDLDPVEYQKFLEERQILIKEEIRKMEELRREKLARMEVK